ncbi:heat stress transcription factor A-5-like, partial [Mangifera indica]|uniref:heat stress transcription factor A-5-like n=1 Tax=Mangifera indica TaxID=29780 RepID=UPI001CFB5876
IAQPNQDIGRAAESRYNSTEKESDTRSFPKNKNLGNEDVTLSYSQEAANNNPGPVTGPARINDVFWEQFLTERPGSSDNEEASSCYRANPQEEQEDRRPGQGISRNTKNIEQLTL